MDLGLRGQSARVVLASSMDWRAGKPEALGTAKAVQLAISSSNPPPCCRNRLISSRNPGTRGRSDRRRHVRAGEHGRPLLSARRADALGGTRPFFSSTPSGTPRSSGEGDLSRLSL